jgi:hypothetical protein
MTHVESLPSMKLLSLPHMNLDRRSCREAGSQAGEGKNLINRVL